MSGVGYFRVVALRHLICSVKEHGKPILFEAFNVSVELNVVIAIYVHDVCRWSFSIRINVSLDI